MNELMKMMERGWNIQLECKGKGREFEMTFEAGASKVFSVGKEKDFPYPMNLYATGNSIEELMTELVRQEDELSC